MKSEELRHKVTVEQLSKAKDTDGSILENWVPFVTVRAGIITTGGHEFYAAQKINAETSAVFKIRFRSGIKTTMRIRYSDADTDRIFEILPPINNVGGLNRELLISAKEVV